MSDAFPSIALFAVLGYPPALLMTREWVGALLASPLAAALILAIFSIPCVMFRLPLEVALLLAVGVSGACAVALIRSRRGFPGSAPESPWLLLLPLGAVFALLTVRQAAFSWDARSIWFFHADWFASGGGAVVDAMRNRAFAFSHPDYPPLAPATNASVWLLQGERSVEVAQVTTAILTASAVCLFAYAVIHITRDRLPAWFRGLVGVLLVAAAYGAFRVDTGTNGYVDVLWAASFSAAAVFLLAAPCTDAARRFGVPLLAVAALTKQEGLVSAVAVAILVLLRSKHRAQMLRWLAVGLAPGLIWAAWARFLVVEPEPNRLGALLRLDPSVRARFRPTALSIWHNGRLVIILAALTTVLGMVAVMRSRREVSGSGFPWIWCAASMVFGTIASAYLVSPHQIDWHLGTSVHRTTIVINLLLLGEAITWALIAVVALSSKTPMRPRRRRREEPVAVVAEPARATT